MGYLIVISKWTAIKRDLKRLLHTVFTQDRTADLDTSTANELLKYKVIKEQFITYEFTKKGLKNFERALKRLANDYKTKL